MRTVPRYPPLFDLAGCMPKDMCHTCSDLDDEERDDNSIDNDENEAPAKRQKVLLYAILLPGHMLCFLLVSPSKSTL